MRGDDNVAYEFAVHGYCVRLFFRFFQQFFRHSERHKRSVKVLCDNPRIIERRGLFAVNRHVHRAESVITEFFGYVHIVCVFVYSLNRNVICGYGVKRNFGIFLFRICQKFGKAVVKFFRVLFGRPVNKSFVTRNIGNSVCVVFVRALRRFERVGNDFFQCVRRRDVVCRHNALFAVFDDLYIRGNVFVCAYHADFAGFVINFRRLRFCKADFSAVGVGGLYFFDKKLRLIIFAHCIVLLIFRLR